jgi:signal transduction histidine kinase
LALVHEDPEQLEVVREARARLVTAIDDLRRAIERSLHDGVQQQLVALGVKLQLARQVADTDPVQLHALLDEMRRDAHEALDTVRQLAWEIYPALLLDRGLTETLRAVATRVEADGIGRYPRDVEAAVYFSCLAVLERVPPTQVTIHLQEETRALQLEVRVEGMELEPMLTVADRIGAVGGETTFTQTSIRAVIPLQRGTESPL